MIFQIAFAILIMTVKLSLVAYWVLLISTMALFPFMSALFKTTRIRLIWPVILFVSVAINLLIISRLLVAAMITWCIRAVVPSILASRLVMFRLANARIILS